MIEPADVEIDYTHAGETVEAKQYACGICGETGHNRRRCPKELGEAAELRQTIEALDVMEAEYERVIAGLDALLTDTRVKREIARRRLAELRQRRDA